MTFTNRKSSQSGPTKGEKKGKNDSLLLGGLCLEGRKTRGTPTNLGLKGGVKKANMFHESKS